MSKILRGKWKCCRCCVEDVKLQNIKDFETKWPYKERKGNSFDVVITVSFIPDLSKKCEVCALRWGEKMTHPPAWYKKHGVQANTWTDMFPILTSKEMGALRATIWQEWENLMKKAAEGKIGCLSTYEITITDTPASGKNSPAQVNEFAITVESSTGGRCPARRKTVFATQTQGKGGTPSKLKPGGTTGTPPWLQNK
jgi:hypothetical protein